MSNCHVSNQIAKHADCEGEVYCSECGGNMYIELGDTDLVCSECGNTLGEDDD